MYKQHFIEVFLILQPNRAFCTPHHQAEGENIMRPMEMAPQFQSGEHLYRFQCEPGPQSCALQKSIDKSNLKTIKLS